MKNNVQPKTSLTLGLHCKHGVPIRIPRSLVASGILITGGSGSGKTNFILSLIGQLVRQRVISRFWDWKGEPTRALAMLKRLPRHRKTRERTTKFQKRHGKKK